MKKQPNTDRISNALAESSLFFNPPAPLDTSTPRIQDTQTPRRPDAQDSRTLDTETSRTPDALTRGFDVTEKADERQTLRLTAAEFRRLGMVTATLGEALDVKKVDKNDVIRCALHRLFEEVAPGVQESDVLKRLRKKYR